MFESEEETIYCEICFIFLVIFVLIQITVSDTIDMNFGRI